MILKVDAKNNGHVLMSDLLATGVIFIIMFFVL